MFIIKKLFKNFDKKINFVLFVEEKKTYHKKLNYILFKFLIIFFFLFMILFLYTSIIALYFIHENNYLSEYVLNLKNLYMNNYFQSNFNQNTQDEINEDTPQVAKEKLKLKAAPSEKVTDTLPQLFITSQMATNVNIEKESIEFKKSNVLFNFTLLSTDKKKLKTIAGSICGKLVYKDTAGKVQTLNYPSELQFDSQQLPTAETCIMGEHVKFSKLRPVVFDFSLKKSENINETYKKEIQSDKATLYFLEKNSKNVVILKEIDFKKPN